MRYWLPGKLEILGESPKKINQELQNIHRITNGKVQYQSQDTSGEATSGLRLVLDLAMSDEVDILQFLIYFFWRFPQCSSNDNNNDK